MRDPSNQIGTVWGSSGTWRYLPAEDILDEYMRDIQRAQEDCRFLASIVRGTNKYKFRILAKALEVADVLAQDIVLSPKQAARCRKYLEAR